MIKMIIKMNEDKISKSGKYSIEQIYLALDRIFLQKGLQKKDTSLGIEYCGHDNPADFACFGKIMLGLKDQNWFMDNADKWLYCSNDDSDDPRIFNDEDLLKHYKNKAIA